MPVISANLKDWIGRTQTVTDTISPVQIRQMAALMNDKERLQRPDCETLPACWHWLYFNPIDIQSRLSTDGHPPRGDFLPPVELPRRMWAGARLHWSRPFAVGNVVERQSKILAIESKSGRSGLMVFVTVGHRYTDEQGLLLDEEHDIVYRAEAPREGASAAAMPSHEKAGVAKAAPDPSGQLRRVVEVDPVMLYRYSAATFNGHRIHYDADYCRNVEGYPGLVVHGPLLATLLLHFASDVYGTSNRFLRFEFRISRPTFANSGFELHAKADGEYGMSVWSTDNAGNVALKGQIGFVNH